MNTENNFEFFNPRPEIPPKTVHANSKVLVRKVGLLAMALLCGALAACLYIGSPIALNFGKNNSLLSLLCLIIFVLGTPVFLMQLIHYFRAPRAYITIDDQGIHDHLHSKSVGLIPWDAIASLELIENRTVYIRFTDPEAMLHYLVSNGCFSDNLRKAIEHSNPLIPLDANYLGIPGASLMTILQEEMQRRHSQ